MYKIIFYKTRRGDILSLEFIDKLNLKAQVKIRKQILLLSEEGPRLKRPYVDYLRDGIYELRVKFSPSDYRILYFFFGKENIIITHGFVKKTAKVPEKEVEKALMYKTEFEERFKA